MSDREPIPVSPEVRAQSLIDELRRRQEMDPEMGISYKVSNPEYKQYFTLYRIKGGILITASTWPDNLRIESVFGIGESGVLIRMRPGIKSYQYLTPSVALEDEDAIAALEENKDLWFPQLSSAPGEADSQRIH